MLSKNSMACGDGLAGGSAGAVGAARVGLEPRLFHPQLLGKSMELVVRVGDEVGPLGVDVSEPSTLSPVVDVDRHTDNSNVTAR